MEGAPSRDTCPPPAGRGADFRRQFCAGGRTALLFDISETFADFLRHFFACCLTFPSHFRHDAQSSPA